MRPTHIVGPNGSLDQPAMEHGLKGYKDTLDRGLSSGGGRAHVMWDTHAGFLCMLPASPLAQFTISISNQ